MASDQTQGPGPASGSEVERLKAWLENPQRLLHLVVASAAAHAGSLHREGVEAHLQEEDVVLLVRLLAHLALASRQLKDDSQAAELAAFFRQRLQGLPADLVMALERILAPLPTPGPGEAPMPVQLAERLVLRLALDSYQRGTLSPPAARELLGRMCAEVDTLRRVLGMTGAEAYSGVLEEQFWDSLPEPERRRVLLSSEAWCVPPRALRRYLEELQDEPEIARGVLDNYAACAHHTEEPARLRAALAMSELAAFYARLGGSLLESAIRAAGRQLAQESHSEIQALLATAFARLSQEAAARRGFPAMRQALERLGEIERTQPPRAEGLRARVAVSSHLREFIAEALRAPAVPRELVEVFRQAAPEAAELLSEAFEACTQRAEQNRLIEMAAELGPAGLEHLRERLRVAPPAAAVPTIGLLSRLDPDTLEGHLPVRLARWDRGLHDRVVRSLAAAGAPERGQLLLHLLDHLDPFVIPIALDEIGMSGDIHTAPRLMRLAGGTLVQSSEPYLRVKAVEALGRLREPAAAPLLRRLVESKGVWRWTEPREIRLAAAQALMRIEPEWTKKFLRRSGLSPAELALAPLDPEPTAPWARQRRYPRIPLTHKLPTLATTLRGQWSLTTGVLSLGGGLAESQSVLPAGAEVEVELQSGLRPVRATALVRDSRPQTMGFEFVRIDLHERSKLRHLLVGLSPAAV